MRRGDLCLPPRQERSCLVSVGMTREEEDCHGRADLAALPHCTLAAARPRNDNSLWLEKRTRWVSLRSTQPTLSTYFISQLPWHSQGPQGNERAHHAFGRTPAGGQRLLRRFAPRNVKGIVRLRASPSTNPPLSLRVFWERPLSSRRSQTAAGKAPTSDKRSCSLAYSEFGAMSATQHPVVWRCRLPRLRRERRPKPRQYPPR